MNRVRKRNFKRAALVKGTTILKPFRFDSIDVPTDFSFDRASSARCGTVKTKTIFGINKKYFVNRVDSNDLRRYNRHYHRRNKHYERGHQRHAKVVREVGAKRLRQL